MSLKILVGFENNGFTLPENIGELGDDIAELNLSGCSLTGPYDGTPHTKSLMAVFFTGEIPKSFGELKELKELRLYNNQLTGQSTRITRFIHSHN